MDIQWGWITDGSVVTDLDEEKAFVNELLTQAAKPGRTQYVLAVVPDGESELAETIRLGVSSAENRRGDIG